MIGDGIEAHRRMPEGRNASLPNEESSVWKMLALMWPALPSHSLACLSVCLSVCLILPRPV
jgi:hypothetical protein